METLSVKIFGTEYKIKSDVDGGYLLRIAKLVDDKMQEIHNQYPQPSTTKTAVLACLNLVDEMMRREEDRERSVRTKLEGLLEKLGRIV